MVTRFRFCDRGGYTGAATLYSSQPKKRSASVEEVERRVDEYLRVNGGWATRELERRLLEEGVRFGGKVLPTFAKPHFIAADGEVAAAEAVECFAKVLERFGKRLLEDLDLRRHIRLPAGSDELLAIDPGYDQLIVVSRLDMTMPPTPQIFEVNTDSPAMMTFTDRIEKMLFEIAPLREAMQIEPPGFSRTRALLDGLLASYRAFGGSREDPTIAIVDWKGEKTANELLHTAADFEAHGCPAVVCDPRELSVVDGKLHGKGRRIDIVQRRVLFPDFVRRRSELEPLIQTYASGAVCVANSLRSFLVGNKGALAMISAGAVDLELSPAETEVVRSLLPQTVQLSTGNVDEVRADKDAWVLKGAFGSGGKEVTLGTEVGRLEWAAVVEAARNSPTVAQRFLEIPRLRMPVLSGDGASALTELFANWNPWVFAGKYSGASTRVSREAIVSITAGGGLLPSLAV